MTFDAEYAERVLRAFVGWARRDPRLVKALEVAPKQTIRGLRQLDDDTRRVLLHHAHQLAYRVLRGPRVVADILGMQGIFIGGDPPTHSVVRGDYLYVHASLGYGVAGSAAYQIYELTTADGVPKQRLPIPGTAPLNQLVPDPYNGDEVGFTWPAVAIRTDPTWPVGLYAVQFVAQGQAFPDPAKLGDFQKITAVFALRPDKSEAQDVLLCWPCSTRNAYTGGSDGYSSVYDWAEPRRARRVSLFRPFDAGGGGDWTKTIEAPSRLWRVIRPYLQNDGLDVDPCTSFDLHHDPNMLSSYNLVVFAGHDEYWSKEMRDNVEAFVASGGNAAFFTGNTCWGQIRLEDKGKTMVCYKSSVEDPLAGRDDAAVAGLWPNSPTNRPENTLTGLSFRRGALQQELQGRAFTVVADGNDQGAEALTKAFTQGLSRGDTLPLSASFESDGVDFKVGTQSGATFPVGMLPANGQGDYRVTGVDGTPSNFKILAVADLRSDALMPGFAIVGYYTNHGTVFSAATTHWALSLEGLAAVKVLTLTVNVVTALARQRTPNGAAWQLPAPRVPPNVTFGHAKNQYPPQPPHVEAYSWELLQQDLEDRNDNPISGAALAASTTGHLFLTDTDGVLWRIDPEVPDDRWVRTNAPVTQIGNHARVMDGSVHGDTLFTSRWNGQAAENELASIPTNQLITNTNAPDGWTALPHGWVPDGECIGLAWAHGFYESGHPASSPSPFFCAIHETSGRWLYNGAWIDNGTQKGAPVRLGRWPNSFVALCGGGWEGRLFATDGKYLYTRDTVAVDLVWRRLCTVPQGTHAIAVYFGRVFALVAQKTGTKLGAPIAHSLWWKALVAARGFGEPSLLLIRERVTNIFEVHVGEFSANGDYRQTGLGGYFAAYDLVTRANSGFVFFYRRSGDGDLVKYAADGTEKQSKSSSGYNTQWTNIAYVNNGISEHIVFYDSASGLTVVGYFDTVSGSFVQETSTTLSDGWTNVVSAHNGTVLFHNANSGTCAVALVANDGTITTVNNGGIGPFNTIDPNRPPAAVPAGQNWIFLYNPLDGSAYLVDLPSLSPAHTWGPQSFPTNARAGASSDGLVLLVDMVSGAAVSIGFSIDAPGQQTAFTENGFGYLRGQQSAIEVSVPRDMVAVGLL